MTPSTDSRRKDDAAKAAQNIVKARFWLVEVVRRLPKYLTLYVRMATDNRIESKAKVGLVTALWMLAASLTGGVLFYVQWGLSFLIGPFAWLPTVFLVLVGLDLSYALLDVDVGLEKEIFGDGNTVQNDLAKLRDVLGSRYAAVRSWLKERIDSAAEQHRSAGRVTDNGVTDDFVREAADKATEAAMSPRVDRMADEASSPDVPKLQAAATRLLEKIPD